MATTLISEAYLKSITPIFSNVEAVELLPAILLAQDIEIQQILGTELYVELLASAAANTLSADQSALIKVIAPSLAYHTCAHAVIQNYAKWTVRGINIKTSDNAQVPQKKDVDYMKDEYRNLGEFYAQRVIDYLLSPENVNKFPKYYASNARKVKPERDTTYSCGMYLGKSEETWLNSGWI